MELLWAENRPLLTTEIVELCQNKPWKDASIHILVNSLLKKEAIKIAGFVKTGKHYSRTFSPTLSREEYLVSAGKEGTQLSDVEIRRMMTALVNSDDISDETLEELEELIRTKRAEKETDKNEAGREP